MTKPNLTTEQFNAIQDSHDVMSNMLDSIYDMQDINLTDIKKLDDAYHQLRFQFKLNEEE